MPSITTISYSQHSPLTFFDASFAFGTRQGAPKSTILLAVVAGAKSGNTALGGIHLEHTLGRRVVSLPLGAMSIPKYLSHVHIPSKGVAVYLAFRTVDRIQYLQGVWQLIVHLLVRCCVWLSIMWIVYLPIPRRHANSAIPCSSLLWDSFGQLSFTMFLFPLWPSVVGCNTVDLQISGLFRLVWVPQCMPCRVHSVLCTEAHAILIYPPLHLFTLSHTCSLSHRKPNASKPRTCRHKGTLEAKTTAENNNPDEEREEVKKTIDSTPISRPPIN